MKTGTQADLIRELKNEHGIFCSPSAISQLVTAKDDRIVKTPGGKIKIKETCKLLVDSGFGKRTKKQNKEPSIPNLGTTEKPDELVGTSLPDIDPQKPANDEEKDQDKIPELSESNKVIAFQKGRKTKAEADKLNQESILLSDAEEVVFNFARSLRDSIQSMVDRLVLKVDSKKTNHEVTQILKNETHIVLKLSDEELKKKIKTLFSHL